MSPGPSGRPPRVSVVVPVKDQRAYLAELLDGLTGQSWHDLEVVVVDDGSMDGSGDLATGRDSPDLPIRVVRLERSAGAVAARLAGVAVAGGEVLAFTDSDCVPDPGWLESAVAAIDDGADLVQGPTRPTGPAGPLERTMRVEREDGLYATCNLVCRRDAYERAGGFTSDGAQQLRFRAGSRARGLGFGEDTLLGWRVRAAGRAVFVPEAVVRHQVLPFDPRSAVSRAWQAGAFPALVREVPALRRTLLRRGWLLGDRKQLWLLGGAAAVLLGNRALGAGLVTRWVAHHARRIDRSDRRWPAQLAVLLGLEVITEAALVTGSVRTRTTVV